MARIAGTASRIAVTIVTVGALAFGASQAAASTARAYCPYNPPEILGICTGGDSQCSQDCRDVIGPNASGYCHPSEGCCLCEW